jgi:hypothetical protein
MEIELHPSAPMETGTFSALVAPEELVLAGLNDNPVLQRFLFLFVSGNFSRLLQGINRRSGNFEVQRAFTAHQLLSILSAAHHTVIFVEHDPTLYDDAEELLGPVAEALAAAAGDALVVLYSPKSGKAFDRLARRADRIFFFGPTYPHAPLRPRVRRSPARPAARGQTTLEGI